MPHRSPHKAGPSLRRVSRTPHEHPVELNGIPPVKASPTKPLATSGRKREKGLHDISTEVFGWAYLEVRAGYFTH
jgi:hypothetical protein